MTPFILNAFGVKTGKKHWLVLESYRYLCLCQFEVEGSFRQAQRPIEFGARGEGT
jgi:hypothetical protein